MNENVSLGNLIDNKYLHITANYLSWFLQLENDYSVIDKMVRVRSDKDLAEALYVALRVKNRLARLAKNKKVVNDELIFLNYVIPSDKVISEVLRLASKDPKSVGIVLADLALSIHPYVPSIKKDKEERGK